MGFEKRLNNDYLMRKVRGEDDVNQLILFHAENNNAFEGATCQCLLQHHPFMTWEDFFIIEDCRTSQIVASSCLIPWQVRYQNVVLNVAMLEMVLSHKNHRRVGLVRELINLFSQEIKQKQFDFSIITGIPYYYRQYGYGYGLEFGGCEVLDLGRIPNGETFNDEIYSIRTANTMDIPDLARCYHNTFKEVDLHIHRSEEYWHYLLEHAKYKTYILEEKASGSSTGYFMGNADQKNIFFTMSECGIVDYHAAVFAFRYLKKGVKQGIRICSHSNSIPEQLAKSLGGRKVTGDQYLLKLTDTAAFCQALMPAFNHRLHQARLYHYNGELIINFFRSAIQFDIREGKVSEIRDLGFVDSSMGVDGGDLCIPPDAFVRLVFGYRDLEQLRDAWPDILIKTQSRYLVETLFPKMCSYIQLPYHYQGRIS